MSREIWVDVTVSNLADPRRCFTARAFVDNGSTDSAMPAKWLRAIGAKPEGSERYALWGRRTARRQFAIARFRIGKRSGPVRVTFEPRFEVPTMGATALENLGYDIDMRNGGLRPYKPRGPTIRRRPPHRLPTLRAGRGRRHSPGD